MSNSDDPKVAPAAVAAPLSEPPMDDYDKRHLDGCRKNIYDRQSSPCTCRLEFDRLVFECLDLETQLAAARATVQQLTQERDVQSKAAVFFREKGAHAIARFSELRTELVAERALRQQLVARVEAVETALFKEGRRYREGPLYSPPAASFMECRARDLHAALAVARGSASPDQKDA